MHVKVKELDPTLREALERVNYRRPDISVEAREKTSMFVGGGAGQRGFAVLVDLERKDIQVHWGSWGGANMFNRKNAVDLDTNLYQLPPTGAVITGSKGASVHAHIVVHPDLLPKMLPARQVELPHLHREALYCYNSIKGGPYRREELARRRVTTEIIQDLIVKGFLVQNKAGATQITTEGKNALGDYRGH